MKIAVVTCTWHRPIQLGQMIKCFLEQDYPQEHRELLILDDAGMYEPLSGPGWALISIRRRFRTLGEKRNATIGLVSPDTEAVAVWDDDDIYLPHTLSTQVATLRDSDWCRPSQVLYEQPDGTFSRHLTSGLFQGGWAFRLEALNRIGGYRAVSICEDQDLASRLSQANVRVGDPLWFTHTPYYVYRDTSNNSYHASYMGEPNEAYTILGTWRHDGPPIARLNVSWPRDYRSVMVRKEVEGLWL
jgi:hypothetical protein